MKRKFKVGNYALCIAKDKHGQLTNWVDELNLDIGKPYLVLSVDEGKENYGLKISTLNKHSDEIGFNMPFANFKPMTKAKAEAILKKNNL